MAPNGPAPPKHDEWLLRQVVSLSVQRLKALSIVPVVPPCPTRPAVAVKASDGADPSATQGRSTSEQQRRERLSPRAARCRSRCGSR